MLSTNLIATLTAALAVATVGLTPASAAPYNSGYKSRTLHQALINYRIRSQASRIARAKRNGRLTWVEARRAHVELSHIRGFHAQYQMDGWLNDREARHLNRLLDANHARIRHFAVNGRPDIGWRRRADHVAHDAPNRNARNARNDRYDRYDRYNRVR